MSLLSIYNVLMVVVISYVTISLVGRETTAEQDVESGTSQDSRLAYLLANLRNPNGVSLLAPPSIYKNKLRPFLQKSPTKRDGGFWIWMPAQGYVPVPRQDSGGNSGRDVETSDWIRCGEQTYHRFTVQYLAFTEALFRIINAFSRNNLANGCRARQKCHYNITFREPVISN